MDGNLALVPRTAEELGDLAKRVSGSGLLPEGVRKIADIAVIMLAGMELGLRPMQAIRSIHVIRGKPVMSADLIVALTVRAPECKYFRVVKTTDKLATYETLREGHPEPTRLTFTIAEAERMGLTKKDNWRRMPAQMLRARCKSALAREVYPEFAMGLYDVDEIEPGEIDTSPEVIDTPSGPVRRSSVGGLPIHERYNYGSAARNRDLADGNELPQWAGGAMPVCAECGGILASMYSACDHCGVCPEPQLKDTK